MCHSFACYKHALRLWRQLLIIRILWYCDVWFDSKMSCVHWHLYSLIVLLIHCTILVNCTRTVGHYNFCWLRISHLHLVSPYLPARHMFTDAWIVKGGLFCARFLVGTVVPMDQRGHHRLHKTHFILDFFFRPGQVFSDICIQWRRFFFVFVFRFEEQGHERWWVCDGKV